ncbi:MAG: dihydrofolate reductase [bacterium]|uniref:Dihydrofolate reductase n=1 Tax=Candidatus Aphodosoma intestinipullorum TaxID=2840674 RepID=A0A940DIW9_9BACT|nr:dihydrofolate reductase [Candidatus Aphodosoma intestinipullorum]
MKIVFTTRMPLGWFAPLSLHTLVMPEDEAFSTEGIKKELTDCDILISAFSFAVTADTIDSAPRLRLIANLGVGYNNIDTTAATERRIMVTNTPQPVIEPTAEHTFTLMLGAAHRVAELDRKMRMPQSPIRFGVMENLGTAISGKTLGIIGMGRIGQSVARKAAAFGMRVIYYNRHRLPAEKESELHAEYMPLDGLLQKSDIITLHTPYTSESHHIIDSRALSLMKPTAILVNTARGACVDEQALVKHLADGKIWGAALDVYEHEPQVSPELYKMDNVLLSPHVGTATVECRQAMAQCVCDNIHAFISGQYERMDWVNKF